MGRNRKVVQGNKRSGSACPIALHHPQQAVGALTSYMGVRNRHMKHQDRHKNACHETRQVPCLVDMKSITKIRQFSSLSRIKGEIKR